MLKKLFQPVDITSTIVFRIVFGCIMLWEVYRYFIYHRIDYHFINPIFSFKYYGFEWVHAWPGNGMYIHFLVMGILSLMIIVGLFYRLAAALFFLAFTYIFLLDQALYLNHFYLVCLITFLLPFIPAHHNFSLDAWLRPNIKSDTIPIWCVWLLRFQIGIPYFYGGIAKLNMDWLHGYPLWDWLGKRSHYPVIGDFLSTPAGVFFFAYGGLLFDLLVVPLLLWKRTRMLAFCTAVFFHLTNAWLFNIGIFPWAMIAATTIFFDPDWPRKLLNMPAIKIPKESLDSSWKNLTVACLTIFFLFQVLVPFRHLLYPGVVHWTEEGHRFAWHMKLRDKRGSSLFRLVYPETETKITVDPREYLTRRQYRKMSTRPDMTLQFAHFLSEAYESNGERPEVYADVFVSLNGRPKQRIIDPGVDLSKVKRDLWTSSWILPLDDQRFKK